MEYYPEESLLFVILLHKRLSNDGRGYHPRHFPSQATANRVLDVEIHSAAAPKIKEKKESKRGSGTVGQRARSSWGRVLLACSSAP